MNSQLTSVTSRDLPMCTRLHLTEHCEKTGVAIALRTVHAEFNEVIDAAIKTTLKNRKVDQKFSQPRWEKKNSRNRILTPFPPDLVTRSPAQGIH